jgi:hypothetical protein
MSSWSDDDLVAPTSTTNRRSKALRRSKSFTPATDCRNTSKLTAARPQQPSLAQGSIAAAAAASTPRVDAACHAADSQHVTDVETAAHTPSAVHAAQSPAPCCPVCNLDLSRVSDTQAGQAAHVNACLDAAATSADAAPHGPTSQHVDLTGAAADVLEQEEPDDMQQWCVLLCMVWA